MGLNILFCREGFLVLMIIMQGRSLGLKMDLNIFRIWDLLSSSAGLLGIHLQIISLVRVQVLQPSL